MNRGRLTVFSTVVVGAMPMLSAWARIQRRDRTHRAGGRPFVIVGLAIALLGLLKPAPEVMFTVLVGGIVAMLVFTFANSYRVWQADPAKRQVRPS